MFFLHMLMLIFLVRLKRTGNGGNYIVVDNARVTNAFADSFASIYINKPLSQLLSI